MNKHYYFLTVLFTALIGVFTNLHAQEPAELGNYQITKIGKPVFQVATNQWYLMGRNKYLVDKGGDNGYVFEDSPNVTAENVTNLVANADCTGAGGTAPANWNITSFWGGRFDVNDWSGNYPEACGNFGGTPYTHFHITANDGVIPDLTITHDPITGLTPGYYQVAIDARMYSETGTYTSANPSGITFYANAASVALNTGTPATDGRGYSGRYTLMAYVSNGTLDIGFLVKNATCNWLAFKNVTLYRIETPLVDETNKVNNAACDEGNTSSLTSWNKTGSGSLSRQNGVARYDLGDTWTGYAGDLYNAGNVIDAPTTVSHTTITGLTNGKYQVSVDARVAGNIPASYTPSMQVEYSKITSTKTYNYVVTSCIGWHYEDFEFSINMDDIKSALNNNFDAMTVYGKNTTGGQRTTDYLNALDLEPIANGGHPADGYRDANGDYTYWGHNSKFYAKLQSTGENTYKIVCGGMDGQTNTPGAYTAQFQFERKKGSETYTATVNVTMKYVPMFSYDITSHVGDYYEGIEFNVDIDAIRQSIGSTSNNDFEVYSEYWDSSTSSFERTTVRNETNGWRKADGSFVGWGSDACYYLQDHRENWEDANSAIIDYAQYRLGGIGPDQNTINNSPQSYGTKLVYTKGDNEAYVYISYRYLGNAYFYVGDNEIDLSTGISSTGADSGYRGTYSLEANVNDGTLDLGFNLDFNTWRWLSFKNVHLYRLDDNSTLKYSEPNDHRASSSKWSITDGLTSGENLRFDFWAGAMNNIYPITNNGDTDSSVGFMEVHRGGSNLTNGTVSYLHPNGIEGLEPGTYKIEVEATMVSETGTAAELIQGATFYANEGHIDLSTGSPGKLTDNNPCKTGTYIVFATVDIDGKLDLHFSIKDANFNWLAWRSISVSKIGIYPGLSGSVKVSNGMPTALNALTPTNPVPANDVKRYLVRFTNDGWGSKGQYWQMQMGTGNYVAAPSGDGAAAECGDPGKFYVYLAEGTRHDDTMDQDLWTVAKDIVLVKPTDGGGYLYYMHDNGVDNIVSFTTNPNNTDERWGVDINVGNPFTLYPVDVCEINPTTPTLSGPEASTTAAPKFYKIKSVGQNDYASYSSITASQYPQLVDYAVGGYAVMGRTSSDVTGNSYWWFSDASSEGYQHQSSKGTKRVHIHNVMMHDVDYSYENHHDEALHSPVEGMVRMYRDNANTQPTDSCLYYLLPTTADGQNGFAISHSEYSGTPNDSWYSAEQVVNEIGQHSNLSWQRNYKTDLNSLYTFELAPISEVWAAVLATKRADMHEGAYFSPTKETLDAIFNKAEYQTANINASNFFARLNALSTELYNAATDASLPTLAPETGGRFYFKNYAVPNYYLAYGRDMDTEDTRLTITEADKPEAANVWEVIPFSDPTLIVRLDDQPVYNGFPSAYYETLPHKPLQRFWLRNRATGHFVTHAPVDKSGLEKLGEGVWRMYDGDTFIGGQSEVGTVNSLDREDADLWYLDVVTNPRTGVRTGVLRTLFCYDYGPWTGTSWDGSYASNGRAIGETGAAIAGYNYPVIQWSLSRHIGNNGKPAAECIPALYAWGVTATDHTRAFSQWVIYDIDTDLPEVGVNYTLKNKYSGKYAYWDGAAEGGSLQQTEKVEDIANNGADDNQNRGVWTLVDLATPASDHWRMANRWAIASGQTKTKLNPLKLEYGANENNGSTFYLPQSNVDPKGIAIGTSSNPPANGEGTWLISYDNKTGVTQGKSENDRAVWGIDKVDRMYDDVVYELSKMLSNVHDGQEIFWMNNVASYNEYITKWNQYSTGNYENVTVNNEYPTYKVIKDLINGVIGDDEFIMPVKKEGSGNRYLIRNKETGRFLTDYGQLMTVDSAAVSLYSIWNLNLDETNADKYLYTLTNEGAAHVMDAADGVRTTKNVKYMTFDPTSGFQMGSTEMKLHFRPDGEGYARLHYSADGDHDMDDDKVLYGPSWGNRVVQSQVLKTNNVFWEVIPVAKFFTNARTLEKFKTETALVQQTIRDMEGYSGGPISLTDTNPTTDKGLFKLNALPGAITGATGSAEGLATIIGNLWNLDEKYLLQWKPGFPVFLDNMCRPTPGARLTTGTETDWTTTATKDESTASQTFEFAGTMNGSYTLVNKSNSKFLATSTAEGATATATTEAANAAQLTVTEIVPSIYSIKDGENRYLSIDDEGNVEWESICGYGALWRIKCNDYEQPTIQKISGVSQIWQGNFINTYSSEYDTQMKASDGVKVYYAKNATSGGGHGFGDGYDASGSTTNENTQKQLQITFYEVENEGGYYYLEAYQPYLIVKSPSAVADASLAKTKANNDEIKVWSEHKGTYESGTLVGKNLLTRLDNDVDIDATNHRKFYELNYIAPGTQVGSIGGQPVYAFGAGFYTPPIGRKFKAGKCVIEASAIGSWLSELRTKVNEVKGEVEPTAIEVILENLDGSTTDLTDLQLDVDNHLADGPVYDLSGRKIADSLKDVSHKGVYVVNGQKVLRK